MPESRLVEARRLRPLIVYFALAFLTVVALGWLVPAGRLRNALVLVWFMLVPVGGWLVFRRR